MSESKQRAAQPVPETPPDRSEETAPAVIKFADLSAYLPGASPPLCLLALYIGERIAGTDRLLPQGFAVALELSVRELKAGVHRFEGEPFDERFRPLAGLPSYAYPTLLRQGGTELAKVGFSEVFAEQAMRFFRG